MRNSFVIGLMCASALVSVGCAGAFDMSVPDAVTVPDEPAHVVVRLRRQEVWMLKPPVRNAVVQVEIQRGPRRAAYTNDDGYAASAVPAPDEPGKYGMRVCHQDPRGDEVCLWGACYVMDPTRPVVVVEYDAVQDGRKAGETAGALWRLHTAGAQIAYAVDDGALSPRDARVRLAQAEMPDGPLLLWSDVSGWGRPAQVQGSWAFARDELPGMLVAIGRDDDFLEAAQSLDMAPLAVGRKQRGFPTAPDWQRAADAVTLILTQLPAKASAQKAADALRNAVE